MGGNKRAESGVKSAPAWTMAVVENHPIYGEMVRLKVGDREFTLMTRKDAAEVLVLCGVPLYATPTS